jgi:hypothetical protein
MASKKARQALFEEVGFSSARLISSTPCSRCSQAISLANLTGSRCRQRVQKPRWPQ